VLAMHAAYVSGDSTELILEKPIKPGEALREGMHLDIDDELRLVSDVKNEVATTTTTNAAAGAGSDDASTAERKAMKELGLQRARHFGWSNTYVFTKAMGEMLLGQQQLRGGDGDMPVVIVRPSIITSIRADPVPGWMQGTRTIDTLIIGYAKRKISAFLADLRMVMDVVPGDMVVNAMLAAVVAHSVERRGGAGGGAQAAMTIYHPTSSLRNPVTYAVLYRSGRRHFKEHPRVKDNGEVIPNNKMRFFTTIPRFRLYMILSYKLPLEVRLRHLSCCLFFSKKKRNFILLEYRKMKCEMRNSCFACLFLFLLRKKCFACL
jgi:fatty acyl-CoA reductase